MNQAVQHMPVLDEARNTVEVVVHVSENLKDRQRNYLAVILEEEDGIISAEFCPLHYHLMLVRYDRDMYCSQDVLASIRSLNINASLISSV
jgi:hypothetical protein